MSDYSYTDNTGEFIGLWGQAEYKRVVIGRDGGDHNVNLANTDAPKFALEILKAAGCGQSQAALQLLSDISKAELQAKAIRRTERRNELARKFSPRAATYDLISPTARNAIDHIVKAEEEAEDTK